MRHDDTTMARQSQKLALAWMMGLSSLAIVGLTECRAQMRYSGGFTPTRHPRFSGATQPSPPAPIPSTPPSYFPDNDAVYPALNAGAERWRPPQPSADVLPYSILPSDMPWNRADFEEYNELPAIPRDSKLLAPRKYLLAVSPLAPASAPGRLENALLIARLPEHAVFWVEGTRTRSMGRTRYFQSPPLAAGQKYNYRVSVAWIEDGRWVSQTRMVPVQAGLIQAIYLRPAPVVPARAAMISLPK